MVALQRQLSGKVGVAVVSCFDWPDVCGQYNITTYPTVLIFKYATAYISHQEYITLVGIQKPYNTEVTCLLQASYLVYPTTLLQ